MPGAICDWFFFFFQFIDELYLTCFLLWLLLFFIGICADIAVSKHEHWSAFAPLPFEIVISAGQKAKEASWAKG